MTANEMSSIAYKKGNWMRYTLWGLAAICILVLVYTFLTMMSSEVSASVPDGYKFAISDEYGEGDNKVRITYYVYDDQIFTETEGYSKDGANRAVLIYDGVNTSNLKNDTEKTTKVCYETACVDKPKVLITIKNLISQKVPREYIGF